MNNYAPIINNMVEKIHAGNVAMGWYTDLSFKVKIASLLNAGYSEAQVKEIVSITGISEMKGSFSDKMALIHSEGSEALEGVRKNLMDDKLPHRKMGEVELADMVIRIFDLAGFMKYDLGGAIHEKLAYNAVRPDHKIENRMKEGGKAF